MKKIGNILFLYFFVFIMCMGASFAWYAWKGSEVNVNVNFAGLDPYIKYSSTKVSGSTITPSEDYTGGISNDITFNKEANGNELTVYGNIYIKVTSVASDDLFKASNLKWTLVSVKDNEKTVISSGNFVGEKVVDDNDTSKMIPANINFPLTKDNENTTYNTTYKVYVWLDENAPANVNISRQGISVETYAEANTEGNFETGYIREIQYSSGKITKFSAYSSLKNITGYMITNSSDIPSIGSTDWIDATGVKSSSEQGYTLTMDIEQSMEDVNNICIKNDNNNKVYCKSIGKYGDGVYALLNADGTVTGNADNLATAISNVPANGTIKVLKDNTSGAVTINKNITLDTNGKTITLTGAITNKSNTVITGNGTIDYPTATDAVKTIINSNGTLTINNSTLKSNARFIALISDGTINVNGGTYVVNASTCSNGCSPFTLSGGIVNINGGTYQGTNLNYLVINSGGTVNFGQTKALTVSGIPIWNNSGTINFKQGTLKDVSTGVTLKGGNLNISGGAIGVTSRVVRNDGGNVSISAGEFYTSSTASITVSAGTIDINGGIYHINATDCSNGCAPFELTGGKVNINSGTYQGDKLNYLAINSGGTVNFGETKAITISGIPIWNNSGTINFKQGTLKDVSTGVTLKGGNLNISGGSIIASDTGISATSGTVNITGGTISGGATGVAIGEGSGSPTLNITGGSITGTNYTGVYIASGTVTLGQKDGSVSTISPKIYSNNYALMNNGGTWNFYDGVLYGPKKYSGSLSASESGYSIKSDVDSTYGYKSYLSNKYILTVKNGNTAAISSVSGSGTYEYGTTVNISANVKTGYTFGAWTVNSGNAPKSTTAASTTVIITHNTTLTANAKANTYTIIYYGNGGSSAQYGTSWSNTATYDSTYTVESNWYTRTGYTFTGWTTKSDGTDAGTEDDGYGWTGWSGTWKYDNGQYGISNNTLKLYARWTPNNYTVTFNANGGTGTMSNKKMTYGTASNLTSNAFKKQYTVTYNYNNATSGNSVSSATANYKFVGWTMGGPNLYSKLNLENNSFSIDDSGMYYLNRNNTSTSTQYVNFFFNTRDDIISGKDYTEISVIKSLTYSGDMNYYVGDSPNASGTITQVSDGVKSVSDLIVGNNYFSLTGTSITNPSLLSRGYIGIPAGASLNIKFRPILIASKYNDIDMYYYDKASAKNLTSVANGTVNLYADWNETSITLPTPTRTGYTFAGWYTASSGGTKVGNGGDSYIPKSNITLYARWTINYYTLTIRGYDSVGTGYYRINGASSYTSFSAFANTITLSVKYGSTYYYYATPADDTVYMAKCSQSSPCSGTMGASDVTVSLMGTEKDVNTLTVSARSLTYNSSAQSLVTASSAQGTVYYAVGTRLTSSNYSSSGSTTIPTRTNAGSYTVYYYTPGNTYYLSKSGSVNARINSKYPSLDITLNPNSASSSFSINSSSASYKCNSSGCSACSGTTCTTFSSSDWINSMSFSWTNTGYSTGTVCAWNSAKNYTGTFNSSISSSNSYTATTNTRAINTGGKRMVKITNNGTSASGGLTTTVYIYFAVNGDGYINGSLADGWFTENDYYYYRKNGNKLTGSTASGKVSAFWLNYDSSAQYYSFDTSGRNVYAWLNSSQSQYTGYSKMASAINAATYGDTASKMYYGTKQPIYFTNGSVKNTTGSSSSRLMGLVISPTTSVYYPNSIYSACTNIAFSSISSTYYSCWYDKTGENDTEYTCE